MQLGVKDAARLLSVPEKTVYAWIEEGRLPACRVGGQYTFNRAELLEWATAQKVKVSPDIFKESGGELPSLADALAAGGARTLRTCRDKADALRMAVSFMPLPEGTDRDFLLEMILSREALSSTGVGEGIAMPHARNPVVLSVEGPLVSLFFLEPAMDFGAADGKPVHTLFVIVSPTIRSHLHMLSRLAFMLHESLFRDMLARRASHELLVLEARRVEEALRARGKR